MGSKQEYYLGLDMGTTSVGWAVTDKKYNLIRKKGKDLWGIREFQEAKTAEERRTHRIARRRRQRELFRIKLIKDYFADEINKTDPNFYGRMDSSKYRREDKDCINAIFDDPGFNDRDYYNKYPTIFHLRKELIEDDTPHDVRLVYLAIVNMFKHRGHFLNSGVSAQGELVSMSDAYTSFLDKLEELTEIKFPEGKSKEIEDILSDTKISRTVKKEKISEVLGIEKKDKPRTEIIKLMCGLKCDGRVMFDNLELEEKVEICFSDNLYEDKEPDIIAALGDDYYSLIAAVKQIYETGMLANLLNGFSYLSFARVSEYEKHHDELRILKKLYGKYLPAKYDYMFRSEEKGSYGAYIYSNNSKNKKERRAAKEKALERKEALYKTIQADLKSIDDKDAEFVLNEIEKDAFLPKQLNAGNGVIPNQVHKRELDAILKNAEKYLQFLNNKDEHGRTVSSRILDLFSFQIPYYIGPVSENSEKNNGTGWVVRKENGPVLPWNIEEKIDKEKTSRRFIERLIRSCTYLSDEKVMPKASLQYEKYSVLNEINNLCIDGERISTEVKQGIYNDLFKTGKKVTRKRIENYLVKEGLITDKGQLTGIDISVNNSLSSYGKYHAVFGDFIDTDKGKKMVEDIIYYSTIYGDSKIMLKDHIEKKYADTISADQIKRILGFKNKDWGRLSKALLDLQGVDKSTGEILSLMSAMWSYSLNFMELINSPGFTFKEALEEKVTKTVRSIYEFKFEDLDDYYFSAPVKRMIWQTVLVIKELQKVMGGPPKRVFIEMTRSDGQKGVRKESRGKKLLELYKNIKEDEGLKNEIRKADSSGMLRSKKLYLYFMQMGRCMYTGEKIDLEDLFNDNLYDIDHIYPRHYVKDDNIENNLVLVKKESNAYKSDDYPLKGIGSEVYSLWNMLHNAKLINDVKYSRLTSKKEFTEEQLAGFIARQMVETSQGTKGVADLLKSILPEPETTVVYSKASNVSDFRKWIGFLKTRSINEFHHAQDAYLNIVVGNTYFVKFTRSPRNFIKNEYMKDPQKYRYNVNKMFYWDVVRGEETAWIAQGSKTGEKHSIDIVKEVMAKNTPLMTRLSFEAKGGIADATLYPADKAKPGAYIPLKEKDPKMQDVTKYGGYSSVLGSYFFLVEHGKEGKRVRSLENVPFYKVEAIEKSETGLLDYCINDLDLIDPVIRMKKIKVQSLVKINGYYYYLTGRTGNQLVLRNAVNMCLDNTFVQYIHHIDKFIEKGVFHKEINEEKNLLVYDEVIKKMRGRMFQKKINSILSKLEEGRSKFVILDKEAQCKVLSEITKNLAVMGSAANLKNISGTAADGITLHSKNIKSDEEIILINQSVTGIYEKRVDFLKI